MYISEFTINSYKSILSSGQVKLSDGFNVIIGQNNRGKSAITEILSTYFDNLPHRSIKTLPTRSANTLIDSTCKIKIFLSGQEVQKLLDFQIPHRFYFPNYSANEQESDSIALEILNKSLDEGIEIECNFGVGGRLDVEFAGYTSAPYCKEIEYDPNNSSTKFVIKSGQVQGATKTKELPYILATVARSRIYLFKAERYNIGISSVGTDQRLSSNAANLPQVLQVLSSISGKFNTLNKYVSTIFPQIKEISVAPHDNQQAKILVWEVDPISGREDLANVLNDCGTGLSQIIAILYVLVTAEEPQTIIIDEPQSFLHPGAIRKLIDILKLHPQHQYILTTHSPTVVIASEPKTLLLVTKENVESKIDKLNPTVTQDLTKFLFEIGARLSDVFGSDNILWVEGPTEERCFPIIIKSIPNIHLLGTNILGVKHTGDFESRFTDSTLEIYNRLSQGNGLLPKALAFVFDLEGKSETKRNDLIRRSNGQVHFIPRRMYENYLINISAIHALIATIPDFSNHSISIGKIRSWIKRNKWGSNFFEHNIEEQNKNENYWLVKVNGAKFLQQMFIELSVNRYQYEKIQHGEFITNWLIKHKPNKLNEIKNLLTTILLPENTL